MGIADRNISAKQREKYFHLNLFMGLSLPLLRQHCCLTYFTKIYIGAIRLNLLIVLFNKRNCLCVCILSRYSTTQWNILKLL